MQSINKFYIFLKIFHILDYYGRIWDKHVLNGGCASTYSYWIRPEKRWEQDLYVAMILLPDCRSLFAKKVRIY